MIGCVVVILSLISVVIKILDMAFDVRQKKIGNLPHVVLPGNPTLSTCIRAVQGYMGDCA